MMHTQPFSQVDFAARIPEFQSEVAIVVCSTNQIF